VKKGYRVMTIDEPAEQKYRPEGEGGKDSAATGGKGERDKRGDPPAPETADGEQGGKDGAATGGNGNRKKRGRQPATDTAEGEQGGKDGAATGSKGGEGDKSGTRAHPVQRLKVSRAEKGAALEQMKYRNGSEREESPLPMPQLPPSQPQARCHSRRLRHLRCGRRRYCPCFFCLRYLCLRVCHRCGHPPASAPASARWTTLPPPPTGTSTTRTQRWRCFSPPLPLPVPRLGAGGR
jgi:hypothetical protein